MWKREKNMGTAIIENKIDMEVLKLSFEDGLYLAHKAFLISKQDDRILGNEVAELSNNFFLQLLNA